MDTITFIYLAILILLTVGSVLASFYIYKKYIVASYQKVSFTELLTILKFIIDGELNTYDETIFRLKGSITNSNFENFYRDLTSQIIDSIPDNFYVQMKPYLSKEAVIKIICRDVKKYLASKVN